MELTPIEFALVFTLLAIMALGVGWVIVRGAKRNARAERAELRIAAGELGTVASREFALEPCAGCGSTTMDLVAIRDGGAVADFSCPECGTEGIASMSGDGGAKVLESWQTYSKRRKAFDKRTKPVDAEAVRVQLRVRKTKKK